jgi:hypothetical protein
LLLWSLRRLCLIFMEGWLKRKKELVSTYFEDSIRAFTCRLTFLLCWFRSERTRWIIRVFAVSAHSWARLSLEIHVNGIRCRFPILSPSSCVLKL